MSIKTLPIGLFYMLICSIFTILLSSTYTQIDNYKHSLPNSNSLNNLITLSSLEKLFLTESIISKLFICLLVLISISIITNILNKSCHTFISTSFDYQKINSLNCTIFILLLHFLISSKFLPIFIYSTLNLGASLELLLRFSLYVVSFASSFYLIFNLGTSIAYAFGNPEKQSSIKILQSVGLFFVTFLILSLINKAMNNLPLSDLLN